MIFDWPIWIVVSAIVLGVLGLLVVVRLFLLVIKEWYATKDSLERRDPVKTDKEVLRQVSLRLMILVAILLGSGIAMAQVGYPEPTDLFVNDYAGLLTADDTARLKNLFTDLKHDTGVEAVVVTINSIGDYDTGDETIESFATNLFNTWGIGDKERNDGVLMLVAVKDREVRVEVGAGYGDTQNANMQEVINEHMLPYFKEENYSRGIYLGARAVVGKLTGTWPEDLSQVTSGVAQPSSQGDEASSPSSTSRPFANPLNYVGPFLLVIAVAWFFHDIWATRSRRKNYSKVRTYSAIGAIAGAILALVFSVNTWRTWLAVDSATVLRVSNCNLMLGVVVGAFFGSVIGLGAYRRGLSGRSYGGGSFGGGRSSGGGASGKW